MIFTRTPTPDVAPPPVQPAAAPAKPSQRWLRWAVPLLAFLIGLGVGTSGSEEQATASASVSSLRGQLESSQEQVSELDGELDRARDEIRQATAEGEAQLEKKAALLEERSSEVEQRAKEVYAREKAVRVAERAVRAADGASTSSSQVDTTPDVVTAPEPSTSVSYANCDAARAAGAAPVYEGDPGYGRHLDREGDGIGCE